TSATSRADSGLTCGIGYTYQVRAVNAGGYSSWVTTSPATTTTVVCAPSVPTGFSCAASSGTSINCSWTGSAGATTYELQRNSTTIQNTSATSKSDTGLECKNYNYQVRAVNAGGTSSWVTAVASPNKCYSWTKINPAGVFSYEIAMTPTASRIFMGTGSGSGSVYTSINQGTTWTISQLSTAKVSSLACSSDGVRVIAGMESYDAGLGRVFMSTNSGTSWSQIQPIGDVDAIWASAASSSNGARLYLPIWNGPTWIGGRVYTSANYGSTWTEIRPAGDVSKDWLGVATSADGTRVVVNDFNQALYLSSDSGATWTQIASQPADIVGMSSDGSSIIYANTFYPSGPNPSRGALYISKNYGATFTESGPFIGEVKGWDALGVSGDGTHFIAGISSGNSVWGGRIYVSTDSGTTWTETMPAGNINVEWGNARLSSDGTKALVNGGGNVYYGVYIP
ncbi:MAG: hypothetical protein PHW52_05020, partial [Candidatus Pacebacteria bacterium]|nr:hypothetical protein [Candidatus Paceibacterota bacterium]